MTQAINFPFRDISLVADLSGALHWPDRALLAVADLHLEKGSAFAGRGRLLPPYDSRLTLQRLAEVIGRLRPRTVVCLGDSFHDATAAERLGADDARLLGSLVRDHDWLWVLGNHDPAPPRQWGGRIEAAVVCAGLTFRHEATAGTGRDNSGQIGTGEIAAGEICGHHHPVAAVRSRAGRIRARCFAEDGRRLMLPAFGAYTGGLNVLDPALRPLFGPHLTVMLMGPRQLHRLPAAGLAPDRHHAVT